MLKLKHTIEAIDYSADWWDLYDEPRRGQAAYQTNEAIKASFNAGGSRSEVTRAAAKVMNAFSDVGACDSEALLALDTILDQLFPLTTTR